MAATRQDFEAVIKLVERLNKELVKTGEAARSAFKPLGEGATLKDIKNAEKAIDDLNKSSEELTETQKQQAKLNKRLSDSRSKEAKEIVRTREAIRKQNLALKQSVKIDNEKAGSLNQLRAKLADAKRRFDELSESERKSISVGGRLKKQINSLDKEVRKVEESTGRFQRNVGNYPKVFGQFSAALVGGVGAVTGLVAGLRDGVKRYREFEDANSNLQAVLGVSKMEMGELRTQAQELGASTSFSAGQVTQLQTELAKLGFPTEDILQMSESTLAASAAMGSGLGETAALTGATLKAFGLDASEASRVNDVLSKSTSASALDFSKLQNSMSTIAPVANSFGFSLEGTTALLGNLSNAGFDASSAATATRNILLNLADSNGKLAKSLKEPVKDLPSLVKGLKQLKEDGIDLGEALELTDKRSVAAFSTFLDGTDSVLELNTALEQAGGTAQMMADTQLDNLTGDLKIMESAWEGLVLSVLAGDSAFSAFSRNLVQGITNLLGFLTASEDVNKVSFENSKAFREEAESSQLLLDEYEALTQDGIEPTAEEKEKLEIITLQLKDRLGESVIAINEETGAFELNTDAVREQIKAKRLAADDEARTLASRLKGVQEEIKVLEGREKTERRAADLRKKEAENTGVFEAQKQAQQKATGRFALGIAKLTDEQREAQERLDAADQARIKTTVSLREQREREAELLEQLKELNFDLADVENLFNDATEEQTEIIEENTDAQEKNNESKKTAQQIADENFKIFVANEKRRIELLDEGIVKELEKEQLRFTQAERSAKKNNEDLELVEEVHQKKLKEIRDKFREDDVDGFKAAIETKRGLNTEDGNEALKRAQKQSDDLKKQAEQQAELEELLTNQTIKFLENSTRRRSELKQKELDEELNGIKSQQSKLEDLAAKGDKAALASLSLAQQREGEIRKEQEKELQRQKTIEAGLAAFKVFSAKTEQGDKNALGNTIKDLTALTTFIDGLSKFWDGADTVGDTLGSPQLPGKDGHIVRVDGSEQVWSGKDRKDVNFRTRKEIKDIISLYDAGLSSDKLPQFNIKQQPYQSNEELLKEVRELQYIMSTLPKRMPKDSTSFDAFRGALSHTRRVGKSTVTKGFIID